MTWLSPTTLACKSTDVSMSNPSKEFVLFSWKFADYLYGPAVHLFVSGGRAKVLSGPQPVRLLLNGRALLRGLEELVLLVFGTEPGGSVKGLRVEVDINGLSLPHPLRVTFASPDGRVLRLPFTRDGRKVIFTVPEVEVWALVVVGAPSFPGSS